MTGTPFYLVQVYKAAPQQEKPVLNCPFSHIRVPVTALCSGDPLLGCPIQQTEAAAGCGSWWWLSWAGSQFLELLGCLGTNISLYCPVSQDSQESRVRRELGLEFSNLRQRTEASMLVGGCWS